MGRFSAIVVIGLIRRPKNGYLCDSVKSVLESQSVSCLPSEVRRWRVRYADQRTFGSSVAENTCAWTVVICLLDTTVAANP
jgi:hypothetical protein